MIAVYKILEIALTQCMKFVITITVNNIMLYLSRYWIQYIVVSVEESATFSGFGHSRP